MTQRPRKNAREADFGSAELQRMFCIVGFILNDRLAIEKIQKLPIVKRVLCVNSIL